MHSVASTVMVASYIIQEVSTVANSITEPIFFLVSAMEERSGPLSQKLRKLPCRRDLSKDIMERAR